jgi:hypothetical protein
MNAREIAIVFLQCPDPSSFSQSSLGELLDAAEKFDLSTSFGEDIDQAQRLMFTRGKSLEEVQETFLKWISRYQPCLFARLGARHLKGVEYDICWITAADIGRGDGWVSRKIQAARRSWKDRTAEGLASGFLIMFHDARLAWARPGRGLLEISKRLVDLYLVENAPISCDTIYTEALPYRNGDTYGVFKGGVNLLYAGAHRTLNHDRRVPGGALISVNSPGHLAAAMTAKGIFPGMSEAVQWIYDTAMASVGNGGVGCPHTRSTTWHNIESDDTGTDRPRVSRRPVHIPEGYSGRRYSAPYHSDVLLPSRVMESEALDPDPMNGEVWTQLIIDYISEIDVPTNALNYGLFHPHPIAKEARYHNPWPPRADHLWQRLEEPDQATRRAWQQIRKPTENERTIVR